MMGRSLLGSALPNDIVNSKSVVNVKPHDSGVMIGYQVDDFTHICLQEWFIAWSHSDPGFLDNVCT